jgi:hypothetical protein
MPAPLKERQVREGRVIARLAWGVDEDGSRYEIACFDGPELTLESDQAGLIELMEHRIRNVPGVRVIGREERQMGGLPVLELRLEMQSDRIGRYWIFLQNGRRLFEVSVVGPPSARLTEESERFFNSFQLNPKLAPTR